VELFSLTGGPKSGVHYTEGGDRLVHHLSAEIGDTRFSWVMPEGLKSKRVTLSVDRKNPKERAEERKKQRKVTKKQQKKK
jgi:hypothetical protein